MSSAFIDLPVLAFREEIVRAVDENQVTIITAETGAGKSTQIPQYLVEHGYMKVIVTQPRILAARNLSTRVREEWAGRTAVDSSEIIGYRTAHERDDSPDTRILYCTDGLQLVRELTGSGTDQQQILVLDEVHEWNENMEVLVAWAKKRCQEEPRFKVVIMSATIETEALAAFFETTAVVSVPGRTYEVAKRRGTDVLSEIMQQLNDRTNANMLVFLPGKAEIQEVLEAIQPNADKAGVPVLSLHAQIELAEQQKAFAHYPAGKVVLSTNIAQTSVTIDDIDVVIDSGLERRSEVRDGVEGLFIAQISQADCQQRAGRAGRTKPGQYILAPFDTMPCLSFEERPAYPTPEILRKHIDRLTLRLANVGIDIEQLDFYHDPSRGAMKRAKQTLIALGALTSMGEVTAIGRAMERFPVASNFGRMLVEAQDDSDEIRAKLAAVIAIQEVGGIIKGGTRYTGWRTLTRQTKSDLLAQYEVYLSLPALTPEELEELGIITKNVVKANEVLERLRGDVSAFAELTPITVDEEPRLLRCIAAGFIDQLWTIDERGEAVHIFTKKARELSSSTVVRNPRLIAGMPFDLQIPAKSGDLETLHLVQDVTLIDTDWLVELAPHLFSSGRAKLYYDPRLAGLARRQQVRLGSKVLEGSGALIEENTPQNQRLFIEHFSRWALERVERSRRQYAAHHTKRIPPVSLDQIKKRAASLAGGAIHLEQLNSKQRYQLIALSKLETYFDNDFMNRLAASHRHGSPHQRPHGWRPPHRRHH